MLSFQSLISSVFQQSKPELNIVIFYFEPFGGRDRNCSFNVASEIKTILESQRKKVKMVKLPVNWTHSLRTIDQHDSDITTANLVLFLGENANLAVPAVETRATSIKEGNDNANQQPKFFW